MVKRHRLKTLMNMGAVLGLCAVGCYPEDGFLRPGRPGAGVSQRPSLLSSVQVFRPTRASTPSGEPTTEPPLLVRPTAGVSTTAAVVRPPSERYRGGAVVTSAWRPLERPVPGTPRSMPVAVSGSGPLRFPAAVAQASQVASAPAEPVRETVPPPEQAPLPRGGMLVAMPHAVHPGPLPPVGPGPLVLPPYEGHKLALPTYMIEPPDVLLIEFQRAVAGITPVTGEFLVGPDGTVNLGVYGRVAVGGLTLELARQAIGAKIQETVKPEKDEKGNEIPVAREVVVDVIGYNSKFYYIVTDGGGYGAQVYRIPVNGSDTVLDALGKIGGLPGVASKKKIWVARSNPSHPGNQQVLPVDWNLLVEHGSPATNYQMAPGDRLFVQSDSRIKTYSNLDKFLAPFDRVFRSIFLGTATINSIKSGTSRGGAGALGAAATFIPF
jgi:polysaccharide biosynthesis/export protein